MSPTKRAISKQGKIQRYLMGYSAGYIMDDVIGDNKFYIMDNVPTKNYLDANREIFLTKNYLDANREIFLTKDAALKAISELPLSKPRTRFVWPYFYSTDNPKHAKGYKLMSDCSPEELEKIEFVK